MDSRIYWIWLAQALGQGESAMGDLLDTFGSAAVVYTATQTQLREAGLPNRVIRRLKDKSLAEARAILNRVTQAGDWVLTPEDALYPVNLHRLADRPAALYCRGNMPDVDARLTLAVVGTRKPTEPGFADAYMLAAGLAAGGAIIVSGGATGIDAAAHSGALENGGITIAVMGCPVNGDYPIENRALRQRMVDEGSLLISEFPHGSKEKCIYQIRNRLIAGLSHGVCLGETPLRSGGLITSRLGREQGKEVFALPGALAGHKNDGAHREIRNGATLITCATDVLEDYVAVFPGLLDIEAAQQTQMQLEQHPTKPSVIPTKTRKRQKTSDEPIQDVILPPAVCPETASEAAKQVYARLSDTPRPVDDLAADTGLPIPALLGALTELEMFGCAAVTAGQQYRKR